MLSDKVFTAVYEHFAHSAITEFNAVGDLPPHLFGVVLDAANENVESVILVPDSLAGTFFRDERGKDLLASFIRFLLRDDSPFTEITDAAGLKRLSLVVQVNEMWMAERRAGEPVDAPPAQCPDRTEGIGVFVHAVDRTAFGYCPILEAPRRAEYRPLEPDARFIGRMSMNRPCAPGVTH